VLLPFFGQLDVVGDHADRAGPSCATWLGVLEALLRVR
jgi:hypothetical protein